MLKVIEGKDDWLFLDKDSNNVNQQLTGKKLFTEQELYSWKLLLEQRSGWFAKHNISYFYLVVPNKGCVYQQYLPEQIQLSSQRCINQLTDYLKQHSFFKINYPLDELREASKNKLTYPQGDTHWNHFGAYVGYNHLISKIARSHDVFQLPESSIEFYPDSNYKCDLSIKLSRKSSFTKGQIVSAKSSCIFDNSINNRGRLRIFENSNQNLPKAVVFHDSFLSSMIEFLAESFSRLVVVWQPNIDYKIVEREQPDIVISQQVERFLIHLPNDAYGMSNQELVAAKLWKNERKQLWNEGKIEEFKQQIELARTPIVEDREYHNSLLQLANYHEKKSQWLEAAQQYQQLIHLTPKKYSLYLKLGKAFKKANKTYRAIAAYQSAIEINPDLPGTIYKQLGDLLAQKCNDANSRLEAIAAYQKAAEIKSDWNASFYVRFADLFVKQGNLIAALEHYNFAVKLQPDMAKIYPRLGNIMLKQGQLEQATNYYLTGLELDPQSVGIHKKLGDIFARRKKFERAKFYYSQALELKPDLDIVNNQLKFISKKLSEAIA